MKKNIALYVVLIICLIFVGCGGGGGGRRSEYYYKWSNGGTTSASAKLLPKLNSVAYADDEGPAFLGSEIPPFSSVDDGGRPCGTLLILTYFNGTEVKSTCTCDPADGEIVGYDLIGNSVDSHIVPSFVANRQGLFHVTATYEEHNLDIPVRVYHFGHIYLIRTDLDKDGIDDLKNLTAPYGYQVINHPYMSLITSAPGGEYSPNAPLAEFTFGKIYIIKTSSGKYSKVWPTGSAGENNYLGMDFLSDENGNFAY